jgi:hypothetical protein
MKTLTSLERRIWCEERGLRLENSGIVDSKRSVAFSVPEQTHRLLDLTSELFSDEQQFAGGLFWVIDLGSRSDEICRIGLVIHSAMREASDGRGNLVEKPQDYSFLFDRDERSEAQTSLLHTFLFGWGAFFVPEHTQYYFFINPDGVFEAFTENDQWIQFFSGFPEMMGMRQGGRWISRRQE